MSPNMPSVWIVFGSDKERENRGRDGREPVSSDAGASGLGVLLLLLCERAGVDVPLPLATLRAPSPPLPAPPNLS